MPRDEPSRRKWTPGQSPGPRPPLDVKPATLNEMIKRLGIDVGEF
jgi:hypothetical protein